MRRAVIDATLILLMSLGVLLLGQPQPFSILTGGTGALTAAYILVRAAAGDYDDE